MSYTYLEDPEGIRVTIPARTGNIGEYDIVADDTTAVKIEVLGAIYLFTTDGEGELQVVALNGSVRIKPGGGVNSFYIETVADLLRDQESEDLSDDDRYAIPNHS